MKRRVFLNVMPLGGLGIILSPSPAYSLISKNQFDKIKQIFLKIGRYSSIDLPEGKHIPFGWPAMGIAPGTSVILKPEEKLHQANSSLLITVALETWDKKLLRVSIPNTGIYLGEMEISYSSVLVPYELKIDPKYARQINRHGLEIKLEAEAPFWFFDQQDAKTDNRLFLPHLVVSENETGTTADFLDCFLSVNSIQAFGWREGTVLDGLWQIYSRKKEKRALQTINRHFSLFFDDHQNLRYETAHSVLKENQIDGIESTIPFATLARLQPRHPILKTVVNAWDAYIEKKNGMVIEGSTITAEGCYTVAYPMAVIGNAWQQDSLKNKALQQLKHRFVLIENGDFYLRYNNGNRTYRNWARGAAWFLIGFARTISELDHALPDREYIDKFKEGVDITVAMQRNDGLWSCFMHEDVLADTSGSAGIAAAILTGINSGFLPGSYRQVAEKCWNGLQKYITPEGFLKGVAQDNRGGIELQQRNYRVIAQMGMGLMAQLYAARKMA